ncbi:MAG TPA: rod shape-determining protein MreC, partial [Patescibacteria group bacterium]|nr:rod shape-determining protein MreC [Patescibacteria group bacterium]
MFSNRWVQIVLTAVLVGLFIILVNFGYFDFVRSGVLWLTQPVVRGVSSGTHRVKSSVVTLLTLRSQLLERDEVLATLKKLQVENAKLSQERSENERLRLLLNLKHGQASSLIAAEIVSRDPTGISGSVVIDRGRRDGISSGDAVVDTLGNLVGIVSEVFDRSARFLLITDGLIKIDARIQGSNALGIIAGSHSLGLSLQLVSNKVQFEKGDRIVSSGL